MRLRTHSAAAAAWEILDHAGDVIGRVLLIRRVDFGLPDSGKERPGDRTEAQSRVERTEADENVAGAQRVFEHGQRPASLAKVRECLRDGDTYVG